jgi:hypothetical protein
MSTYGDSGITFGKIITWVLMALLAIAALKLAFWVVGAAVGLGFWLIFTIGPILLIGWLVIKMVRYVRRTA